jgi:hypothetical protein
MATYHVAVLIWFGYLLVPEKVWVFFKRPKPASFATSPATAISSREELDLWNRELERLLQ